MKISCIYVIIILFLISGCKKDEETVYPQVVKEFVTLKTGAAGQISQIITDWNEIFLINQDMTEMKLQPNVYYRAVSNYQPLTRQTSSSYGTADLYSATGAYAGMIVPASSVSGGFRTDPVKVSRIWKRGKFINMELLIQGKDQYHSFAFIEDGKELETGNVIIKIAHDSNNDFQAFTQSAYLSIQLTELYGKGDSVSIYIRTEEKWERHSFPINLDN